MLFRSFILVLHLSLRDDRDFFADEYLWLPEEIQIADVYDGETIPVDRGSHPVKGESAWSEIFVGYEFPERKAKYVYIYTDFGDEFDITDTGKYSESVSEILCRTNRETDRKTSELFIRESIMNFFRGSESTQKKETSKYIMKTKADKNGFSVYLEPVLYNNP